MNSFQKVFSAYDGPKSNVRLHCWGPDELRYHSKTEGSKLRSPIFWGTELRFPRISEVAHSGCFSKNQHLLFGDYNLTNNWHSECLNVFSIVFLLKNEHWKNACQWKIGHWLNASWDKHCYFPLTNLTNFFLIELGFLFREMFSNICQIFAISLLSHLFLIVSNGV